MQVKDLNFLERVIYLEISFLVRTQGKPLTIKAGSTSHTLDLSEGQCLLNVSQLSEDLNISRRTIRRIIKKIEDNFCSMPTPLPTPPTPYGYVVSGFPEHPKNDLPTPMPTPTPPFHKTDTPDIKTVTKTVGTWELEVLETDDKVIADTYSNYIKLCNHVTGKNYRGSEETQSLFYKRIREGWVVVEMAAAMQNAQWSDFLREKGLLTPKYILEKDRLEKWYNNFPESDISNLSSSEITKYKSDYKKHVKRMEKNAK